LADVMEVQTQLMQTITHMLAQNNNNNHMAQHHNVPEGFQKKVENFNKLRPPTFDNSADPMDADNWLREMEKKLELTKLTEEECVTVAAHQLIPTASAWWDSYCDSQLDPLHIGWDEFVEAFRDHQIPEAVMDRKANEFRHLKMGGMSV
jgi:iron uptake system EfeUOB component EfeO/EfeM